MNNKKHTKLFTVAAIELSIMLISLKIIRILSSLILLSSANSSLSEILPDIVILSLFIIPIIACLIYMKMTYPRKLDVFVRGGTKKSVSALGIGLLIGFLMNALLCILAFFSGSIKLQFQTLDARLLLLIIPCFIQCSAEEVLLRGYVSSYLEDNYKYDVVAFVGGILFIFHHINNMKIMGFNSLFALNVFMVGIFLYFIMKLFNSIWVCFGFHTAWNFTQEYIFGTPNSGMSSNLSIMKGTDGCNSMFFNTVYGNEGTLMCSILIFAGIFVVAYFLKKKTSVLVDDDITPYSF